MLPATAVDTALLQLLFTAIGLVFGSFGNVLVCRLPAKESIGGRSRCPCCSRTLSARELIPVVSYVVLRGRCSGCKDPISCQYPILEFASAGVFLYALFHVDFVFIEALLLGFALWLLLLIAVIDARTQTIPDVLNITFLIVGVAYGVASERIDALAPLIGAGFFAAQWAASRGQWVGSGDIILAAGIGALLGAWPVAVFSLGLAYILGAIVVCGILLFRRNVGDHVAFGPFLAAAAFIGLVAGDAAVRFVGW
jgi:prepilin signal peptidase PulO-like enzyme (type II secretory pathway)